MKITVTPMMLCDLLGGYFTLEACEKICDFYAENDSDAAPHIGDIRVTFGEMPADSIDEEEGYYIISYLDNGNVLYEH